MVCKKCGNQLPPDLTFCIYCGNRLISEPVNHADISRDGARKNLWLFVIPVTLILIVGAVVCFFWFRPVPEGEKPDETSAFTDQAITERPVYEEATETESVAPVKGVMETEPPAPPAREVNTSDLYRPSLTYKRMNGIGNTVMLEDDTFFEIRNVIYRFDSECEDYMNGVGGVPQQLRPGSTAYDQQTGYRAKHPTLSQRYETIDVLSARGGGGYYYAWVTETLSVNEDGVEKTETSHWVYKLSKSGSEWYIDDYTYDPAYK